jgi:hypothetical protein
LSADTLGRNAQGTKNVAITHEPLRQIKSTNLHYGTELACVIGMQAVDRSGGHYHGTSFFPTILQTTNVALLDVSVRVLFVSAGFVNITRQTRAAFGSIPAAGYPV